MDLIFKVETSFSKKLKVCMHHVVICIFTVPIIFANLAKLFVHLHFYLSIVTKFDVES